MAETLNLKDLVSPVLRLLPKPWQKTIFVAGAALLVYSARSFERLALVADGCAVSLIAAPFLSRAGIRLYAKYLDRWALQRVEKVAHDKVFFAKAFVDDVDDIHVLYVQKDSDTRTRRMERVSIMVLSGRGHHAAQRTFRAGLPLTKPAEGTKPGYEFEWEDHVGVAHAEGATFIYNLTTSAGSGVRSAWIDFSQWPSGNMFRASISHLREYGLPQSTVTIVPYSAPLLRTAVATLKHLGFIDSDLSILSNACLEWRRKYGKLPNYALVTPDWHEEPLSGNGSIIAEWTATGYRFKQMFKGPLLIVRSDDAWAVLYHPSQQYAGLHIHFALSEKMLWIGNSDGLFSIDLTTFELRRRCFMMVEGAITIENGFVSYAGARPYSMLNPDEQLQFEKLTVTVTVQGIEDCSPVLQ